MGILFLVALVLAWPTFGISVVVWFCIYIYKSSPKGNNKAWASYEECLEHRQRKLAAFRANATREVLLIHPDAKLLMNNQYHSFLAYSENDEALFSGYFLDNRIPDIDFVSQSDPEPEIQKAADAYRRKVNMYSPGAARMHTGLSQEEMEKGFWFEEFEKSDLMIGARVSLNGKEIALSSFSEPKANGYFTKSIYNEVALKNSEGQKGISILELEIPFGNVEMSHARYEFIFDGQISYREGVGFERFQKNFSQIIGFLASIEDEIRTPPKSWAEESPEWPEFMASHMWPHRIRESA